jgi:hypothetical protein
VRIDKSVMIQAIFSIATSENAKIIFFRYDVKSVVSFMGNSVSESQEERLKERKTVLKLKELILCMSFSTIPETTTPSQCPHPVGNFSNALLPLESEQS